MKVTRFLTNRKWKQEGHGLTFIMLVNRSATVKNSNRTVKLLKTASCYLAVTIWFKITISVLLNLKIFFGEEEGGTCPWNGIHTSCITLQQANITV